MEFVAIVVKRRSLRLHGSGNVIQKAPLLTKEGWRRFVDGVVLSPAMTQAWLRSKAAAIRRGFFVV